MPKRFYNKIPSEPIRVSPEQLGYPREATLYVAFSTGFGAYLGTVPPFWDLAIGAPRRPNTTNIRHTVSCETGQIYTNAVSPGHPEPTVEKVKIRISAEKDTTGIKPSKAIHACRAATSYAWSNITPGVLSGIHITRGGGGYVTYPYFGAGNPGGGYHNFERSITLNHGTHGLTAQMMEFLNVKSLWTPSCAHDSWNFEEYSQDGLVIPGSAWGIVNRMGLDRLPYGGTVKLYLTALEVTSLMGHPDLTNFTLRTDRTRVVHRADAVRRSRAAAKYWHVASGDESDKKLDSLMVQYRRLTARPFAESPQPTENVPVYWDNPHSR